MQVGHQTLDVVRIVGAYQPGVTVGVGRYLDLALLVLRASGTTLVLRASGTTVHAEQLAQIALDLAEHLALGSAEADRAGPGRHVVRGRLQRDRRRRQGEQRVEVRPGRLGPAE